MLLALASRLSVEVQESLGQESLELAPCLALPQRCNLGDHMFLLSSSKMEQVLYVSVESVSTVNPLRFWNAFVTLIALLTNTVIYEGEVNLYFWPPGASMDDDGDKSSSCNSHHLLML